MCQSTHVKRRMTLCLSPTQQPQLPPAVAEAALVHFVALCADPLACHPLLSVPLLQVVMCEIDKGVCDTSKQFFADTMATAFNDPRANVIYMDAAKYIAEQSNKFDVIIVDSSDPVGPAETLYTSDFYRNMAQALKKDGIVCTQGESQWQEHHLALMRKVIQDAGGMYPVVDYAYVTIPSYPDGQIGFVIATKMSDPTTLRRPKRAVPADMAAQIRYYNSQIHSAAFVLPTFSAKVLADVRPPQVPAAPAVPVPVLTAVAGAVLGFAAAWLLKSRK